MTLTFWVKIGVLVTVKKLKASVTWLEWKLADCTWFTVIQLTVIKALLKLISRVHHPFFFSFPLGGAKRSSRPTWKRVAVWKTTLLIPTMPWMPRWGRLTSTCKCMRWLLQFLLCRLLVKDINTWTYQGAPIPFLSKLTVLKFQSF